MCKAVFLNISSIFSIHIALDLAIHLHSSVNVANQVAGKMSSQVQHLILRVPVSMIVSNEEK